MSDDYDENIEYMFGVMEERERIIKLLEDPSNWYGINIAVYGKSAGTGYPNTKLVIALADFIRGENK